MADDTKRKRGRPRKEELPYNRNFRFNGTEDHEYMRKTLEKELGINGGEVMREALEVFFNMKIMN